MKFLSIAALGLFVSATSFASLNCGSFPGPNGHPIIGASTFSVDFADETAIVTIHTYEIRVGETQEVLPKTFQGVDAVTYENDDYRVFNVNGMTHLQYKPSQVSILCR